MNAPSPILICSINHGAWNTRALTNTYNPPRPRERSVDHRYPPKTTQHSQGMTHGATMPCPHIWLAWRMLDGQQSACPRVPMTVPHPTPPHKPHASKQHTDPSWYPAIPLEHVEGSNVIGRRRGESTMKVGYQRKDI